MSNNKRKHTHTTRCETTHKGKLQLSISVVLKKSNIALTNGVIVPEGIKDRVDGIRLTISAHRSHHKGIKNWMTFYIDANSSQLLRSDHL